MTVVVFDDKLNGHHLEYIHHLYELGLEHPEHKFVFVIPDSFKDVRDKFAWEQATNISSDLFDKNTVGFPEGSFINSMKKSYGISRIVGSFAEKHKADIVFMISVMSLVPFCLISINIPIRVSGIIYQIYLYRDTTSSIVGKILDRLKYKILTRSKLFKNIFILNDADSADRLNEIYNSDRFKFLPDPYMPLVSENINIREYYNIPDNHKLMIHLGALEERKGTLNVLQSIIDLPYEERDSYTFFFAGKVDSAIRGDFYDLLGKIENVQVIVKDEFCSYGFFARLCKEADAILMPYIRDGASSGIIGYASQFKTPVIATSTGLIGTLVETYKLGYLMPQNDVENLIIAYRNVKDGQVSDPDDSYCKSHSVEDFKKTISSRLNL